MLEIRLILVSKNTHFERLFGAFYEFRRISRSTKSAEVIPDDLADDPKSQVVVTWEGDEDLGFALEKEREFAKVDFLMKWRKE